MIWRTCERFGIRPPLVKDRWSDIDWWTRECLLAYNYGRTVEEAEMDDAKSQNQF